MTKIVVNGTFDILHRGHLQMLQFARHMGSELLVCIDTDRRVTELKGASRPINNQADRSFMLHCLRCVDFVMLFDSQEELISIIQEYKPDIMVKGSDYRGKSIVGEQYVPEVIFYDRIEEYSSTAIIQRIANR